MLIQLFEAMMQNTITIIFLFKSFVFMFSFL